MCFNFENEKIKLNASIAYYTVLQLQAFYLQQKVSGFDDFGFHPQSKNIHVVLTDLSKNLFGVMWACMVVWWGVWACVGMGVGMCGGDAGVCLCVCCPVLNYLLSMYRLSSIHHWDRP